MTLDNLLAAYHEGKQITGYRISYQKRDMVVNPQHYRRLAVKHILDIDVSIHSHDLRRYDEVLL